MRITTRVAIGLFLMAGLLIGMLAHQLSQVEKLQKINREVALITLEAAQVAVRLAQGIDGVGEFAAKSVLLGDPDYRTQWAAWEDAVARDLSRLAEVGLSEPEEEVFQEIRDGWRRYGELAPQLLDDPVAHLGEVVATLDQMRDWTEEFIATNEAVVAERAMASADAAEEARVVAWTAAVGALLLAALLSLLLLLSISAPLRRLTRGTHEVARGRFDHRLEVEGPGELVALAHDFNRMAEQLAELEVMKQDFISHVSHELKTPLAAIHETIEILLEEIPGPLTPKQMHFLELSKKSSHRLSGMISDLLEISRLEAGADGYHPEWCDLRDVLESAVEELGPVARERAITLALHLPSDRVDVVCDPVRIGEVASNLLGNAAKFAPEGSQVRVSLSPSDDHPAGAFGGSDPHLGETDTSSILLTVEDEGPGVPDHHKEAIFEKFHQVAGRERLRGQGVGLGLAIARRITQAHQGEIWVEDTAARGAAFHVLLPRVPARWKDQIPPTPPEAGEPESWEEPAPSRRVGGGAATGAGLGVVLLLLLAGCASLPFGGERASAADPIAKPEAGASGQEFLGTSGTPLSIPPPLTAGERVELGWAHMNARSYGDAFREFREVLALQPARSLRAEALWGTALVHLLSDGALGGEEWARTPLMTLAEEFPDTRHGAQAVWVVGLLDELARIRATVAEQEELLRELNAVVELLKQIDLNRRPGGGVPGGGSR